MLAHFAYDGLFFHVVNRHHIAWWMNGQLPVQQFKVDAQDLLACRREIFGTFVGQPNDAMVFWTRQQSNRFVEIGNDKISIGFCVAKEPDLSF